MLLSPSFHYSLMCLYCMHFRCACAYVLFSVLWAQLPELNDTMITICGSPKGKCGLLPQHFHHRVNAVVVLLNLQHFFSGREFSTDGLKL